MVLIIALAASMGALLGYLARAAVIRRLRRRVKALRSGQERPGILRSVTRFLFVTTQIFALVWVSMSYGIAAYATVKLAQAFPVEELSRQAIITLLGMSGLKVAENIFEHNDSKVFGQSKPKDPPENGGEEEHFYDESI